MLKKLLVGGIVGGIVLFLLGWLFYGILLMDFMMNHPGLTKHYDRPMPLMPYLILGNLLGGFFLAYVLVKSNVNTVANGFITAAVVGFLACSSFDTNMYALTTLMSRTSTAVDILTFTLICGLTGIVIALVTKNKVSKY